MLKRYCLFCVLFFLIPTLCPYRILAQQKPGNVNLLSPVSGMIVNNSAGAVWNFDWSDVPNATSYQILIEHTNKKDQLLNTSVNTSSYAFRLPNAVPEHLIKDAWGWWVRAGNGSSWGAWSRPHTLFLATNTSILAPQLYGPAQNTTLQNGNSESNAPFTWTFDWADTPNASSYQLVVSNSATGEYINTTMSTSHYGYSSSRAIGAAYSHGWTWRVRAYAQGGWSIWSKPFAFNVGPLTMVPKVDPFKQRSQSDFATSSKGQQYVRLSNKTNNRQGQLAYLHNDKRFTMKSGFGQLKLQPIGRNFKLLLAINGKFWAIGSDNGRIVLENPDRGNNKQLWDIQELEDGYYRISNVGRKNSNTQSHYLFLDKADDSFFYSNWDPSKSLNGRWHFAPGQSISHTPDRFDNRSFYLRSAATNQYMCLNSTMTSDATSDSYIGVCGQGTNCRMTLIKTLKGEYLIKVERTDRNPDRDETSYFLTEGSYQSYGDVDLMNPRYVPTWRLRDMGGGNYQFIEVRTGRALVLKKGYSGQSTPRGFYGGRSAYMTVEPSSNIREQYWRLN